MRIALFILAMIALPFATTAQDVVKWNFSAKKTAGRTYEVRFHAEVDKPWHIYSQSSPEEAATPTKISFSKNPLLALQGKPKEIGKLEEKYEDVFDVTVKYFNGNVEFVQVVKLKGEMKTLISGNIEYMACTQQECLPAKTVPFSIRLE